MMVKQDWERTKALAERVYAADFDDHDRACRDLFDALTASQIEQLRQLVKHGPLWDGDVISKAARGDLLKLRLASRAVVKGQEGYTVANYVGAKVLREGSALRAVPA